MILENTKIIDAPLDVVWSITQDVESWPEWTPTVTRVTRLDEGPLRLGSAAEIEQPGLPATAWRVTEFRTGRGFTWETRVCGMHMSAAHDLTAVATGTKSTLRIRIVGFLVLLVWPWIRKSAATNLERENDGLKYRCESA